MLFNAIKTKAYYAAAKFLQSAAIGRPEPAELNAVDEDGNSPMHHAVLANDFEMVKIIMAAGPDLSIQNKNLKTPLDLAQNQEMTSYLEKAEVCSVAWRGKLEEVRQKLRKDAKSYAIEVRAVSTFGENITSVNANPFGCAIHQKHAEIVEYIRLHDRCHQYTGDTTGLILAIEDYDCDAIEPLVKLYNLNINTVNLSDFLNKPTALSSAIAAGSVPMTKLLLSLGAESEEKHAQRELLICNDARIKALFNKPSDLRSISVFPVLQKEKEAAKEQQVSEEKHSTSKPGFTTWPPVD